MDTTFWSRFFMDRDDTGRYLVVSQRTGRKYAVEPVDGKPARSDWGDINPATGEVEGSYGMKHRGSVHPSESLVTEENGFMNVVELPAGESPESYISRIDAGYPDGVKAPDPALVSQIVEAANYISKNTHRGEASHILVPDENIQMYAQARGMSFDDAVEHLRGYGAGEHNDF